MKKDCSKTMNFLSEWGRMCKENQPKCSGCPLSYYTNDADEVCLVYPKLYPSEAVEIVQKWSNEHQQKTYAEDFFEKFPNAPKEDDGTPKQYWCDIYGTADKCIMKENLDCAECWNRIMEDKPND